MIQLLAVLCVIFFMGTLVGWAKYFQERDSHRTTLKTYITVKDLYMHTIFCIWQYIEYMELEYPDIAEEEPLQSVSRITGWLDGENEDDNDDLDKE